MIENIRWMLEWYNLVFGLAFVALLLYVFFIGTGIVGGDADHDVGHDHDHDHDGEGHHDSPGMLWGFQSFLGVGRVPLSVIMVVFLALWGVTGLVSNLVLKPKLLVTENWALLSIAIALSVAVLGTHLVSKALGNLVPNKESYVPTAKSFVGLSGIVQFDITETAGTVRIYDERQNLHDVEARINSGSTPIRRGATVTLVENISGTSHFFVKLATGKAS